jgi:hypothetical protein
MALAPHWLDGVINDVVETEDPEVIAQAIANSPKFIDAIKGGLLEINELKRNPPPRGTIGTPTPTEIVRRSVIAAIDSPTP